MIRVDYYNKDIVELNIELLVIEVIKDTLLLIKLLHILLILEIKDKDIELAQEVKDKD